MPEPLRSHGMGKTQVSDILRNKATIKAAHASNISTHKKSRASKYSEVNQALYSWYNLACSKNIYPNGPQFNKAKEIAQHLGKTDFEGTAGWPSKWKARYNVKRMKVSGESGNVSSDSVRFWKERLPEILKGYIQEIRYIYLDETGCFWQALPDSGFGEKGKICRGGKRSKQRFTIAFMVSASGAGKAHCYLAGRNQGVSEGLIPMPCQ